MSFFLAAILPDLVGCVSDRKILTGDPVRKKTWTLPEVFPRFEKLNGDTFLVWAGSMKMAEEAMGILTPYLKSSISPFEIMSFWPEIRTGLNAKWTEIYQELKETYDALGWPVLSSEMLIFGIHPEGAFGIFFCNARKFDCEIFAKPGQFDMSSQRKEVEDQVASLTTTMVSDVLPMNPRDRIPTFAKRLARINRYVHEEGDFCSRRCDVLVLDGERVYQRFFFS